MTQRRQGGKADVGRLSQQDQVAVIKRQLQLCLPGVSVFLDVDDLADIGALEEYTSMTLP